MRKGTTGNLYYIIGGYADSVRRTILAALALVAAAAAACGNGVGSGLFRQYEYEEDVYLSLDGTATMYVNSSIPALNALRGTSFDARPTARIDRAAVRDYFSTPATRVTRVSTSSRNNRQFVHVTIDVDDIRRLSEAAPFAWSTYTASKREGELYVYQQTVGPAAGKDVGQVGLERPGDRGVPPASAEQDRLPQHPPRHRARQHPRVGAAARRSAARACR